MRSIKYKLLSGTVVSVLVGAGLVLGGTAAEARDTQATNKTNPLPVAKAKPAGMTQLAACNPCAAKNPCNPCAAKNPCNPCAAKNPCNPCAAKNPCNPCAAKNPCNPCAANPCNPCAANPCNPCAANPCNPCNPCAAGGGEQLNPCAAMKAYNGVKNDLAKGYARAGIKDAKGYQSWRVFNKYPYVSATHGGRYVNNYANKTAANTYSKFENLGTMPVGSVLAKDSFAVKNGKVQPGPLFLMKKGRKGSSEATNDWVYTLVLPNGTVFGTTGGQGSAKVKFCHDCHVSVADSQDHMLLIPEDVRK